MTQELSQYCEKYSKLYVRQMKEQKKRLTIDIVTTLVYTIHKK